MGSGPGLFLTGLGLSRGSGDLPLCWEDQGCLWPGAVSLYAGVLVCVRATLAKESSAGWEAMEPPPRARGALTAYLSTTKEPSGLVLLLFLLICSFFLCKFCFLNQNQQEFIFLLAPRG